MRIARVPVAASKPQEWRLVVPAWFLPVAIAVGPLLNYWFWRTLFDWWVALGMPEPVAGGVTTAGGCLCFVALSVISAMSAVEYKTWRIGLLAWRPYYEPRPEA